MARHDDESRFSRNDSSTSQQANQVAASDTNEQVPVFLPPQMRLDGLLSGNRVSQMRRDATCITTHIHSFANESSPYTCTEVPGIGPIAATSYRSPEPPFAGDILFTIDGNFPRSSSSELIDSTEWLFPPTEDIAALSRDAREALVSHTLATWKGLFTFREEVRCEGEVVEQGLRPPQIGALHATLATG